MGLDCRILWNVKELVFYFVGSSEFLRLLKQSNAMIKTFIFFKKKYSLGIEEGRLVQKLFRSSYRSSGDDTGNRRREDSEIP